IGVTLIMMVGVGMALPYFLLSAVPEIARGFPRAGPWAEVIKQMMAFLLLATALFFAQPLLARLDMEIAFWWTLFAIIAASGVFVVIRSIHLSNALGPRIIAIAIAVALIARSLWITRRLTVRPFPWVTFSEEQFATALASGNPVLIDFTATWCGNCHWVE